MDINKGWREQLPTESQDKIKKWAEGVVRQWHDDVKPDYIFLTETSAVPYGFVLKEAWKKAYGRENSPKFYRINPRTPLIMNVLDSNQASSNIDYMEKVRGYLKARHKLTNPYIKKLTNFVKDRIHKENPRIIVFDEGRVMDKERTDENYMGKLFKFPNKAHLPKETEGIGNRSLIASVNFLYEMLNKDSPTIFGSQQAVSALLEGAKEEQGHYNRSGQLIVKSRKPTSKFWGTSYIGRDEQSEDETRSYRKKNSGRYDELRGSIVKHPEQRKRAIAYVRELKEIGREAGEELHTELEQEKQKKKLEHIVSGVLAVGGLVSSLFFLSSNVTGNAIAKVSQSSGNILGAVLLVVGLVASWFWLKGKK